MISPKAVSDLLEEIDKKISILKYSLLNSKLPETQVSVVCILEELEIIREKLIKILDDDI
jgi:hypothetical protein